MCYNISLGTLYIKVLYLRADNLRYDFSWVLLTHYVLLAPYGDIAINWTHVDFSLVRFGDILLRQEHITKALPFLLLDGWQPSTGVEGYWLHSKWLTTKLRGALVKQCECAWSGTALDQVMVWCRRTPSHYLKQCWIIISAVWSPRGRPVKMFLFY